MATKKITNISSGIYTREIDLTVAVEAAGTFAGGAIVLTERGPAFEVSSSASFSERRLRLGDLNPKFPSSYYAREFLGQAQNYKEIRILGLEGYNESIGTTPGFDSGTGLSFVIMFDVAGATAAVPTVSPLLAGFETVTAVLKPRRTSVTGLSTVTNVEITTTLQSDGVTLAATDELFGITITYSDTSTLSTVCSLRPERKEYISKIFGEDTGVDPKDIILIQGQVAPLWVEFVIPSLKSRVETDSTLAYRYPGTSTPLTVLDLVQGSMVIDLNFVSPATIIPLITSSGSTVTVDMTVPVTLIQGDLITLSSITGTGNFSTLNDNWEVGLVSGNTFELVAIGGASIAGITGAYTASSGSIRLSYTPTWETEVMQLGGTGVEIPFQTPITPYFVSDADMNGEVKRLFRFFSISDGEAANTEIKVEIKNINPQGNQNKGSFDIHIRVFSDKEDGSLVTVEAFNNCTMNPKSDNYVKRRIGDGEDFELRSRFLFIDMNESEVLDDNSLPYGVQGFPNVTGLVMPDVKWTNQYNYSKSLVKQSLGLCNNNINMFNTVTRDYLSFKNVADTDLVMGKGFHLNPNANTLIDTSLYTIPVIEPIGVGVPVAYSNIYRTSITSVTKATPTEQIKRNRFVVDFYGGFDGFNAYSLRKWDDQTSKDYEALKLAVDVMGDAENLDVDFSVIVTPDMNFQDHASAIDLVLEMVQTRGDALYIPDFRYDIEADPQAAATDLTFSNIKDSYAAIYFPHVQISDLEVNKINVWQPPSIIALATIAATATNEQVWQPPAGSLRTVTDNLVRTRRRMKLPDREILKGANINPVTLFPGSGFEITESRTTQDFLSALSFVHNRLLLGYAKKALNQTLRPLLHQLKGDLTKNAFIDTVTPIFDRIKKLNGVEEFKVTVLSQSDDRTTLNGQVEIIPLYPIERIIVDFVLSNTGVEFSQ